MEVCGHKNTHSQQTNPKAHRIYLWKHAPILCHLPVCWGGTCSGHDCCCILSLCSVFSSPLMVIVTASARPGPRVSVPVWILLALWLLPCLLLPLEPWSCPCPLKLTNSISGRNCGWANARDLDRMDSFISAWALWLLWGGPLAVCSSSWCWYLGVMLVAIWLDCPRNPIPWLYLFWSSCRQPN